MYNIIECNQPDKKLQKKHRFCFIRTKIYNISKNKIYLDNFFLQMQGARNISSFCSRLHLTLLRCSLLQILSAASKLRGFALLTFNVFSLFCDKFHCSIYSSPLIPFPPSQISICLPKQWRVLPIFMCYFIGTNNHLGSALCPNPAVIPWYQPNKKVTIPLIPAPVYI